MTSIKEALKIIQLTIKGDQIEAAVVDVGTMMPLGKVVSDALAQLDSADVRENSLGTVTICVPSGYKDAADFLKDCEFQEANPEPSRVWSARTHDEIIKRLMSQVGMPNSMSLYQAFKQFANELHALSTGLLPDASPGNGADPTKLTRDELLVLLIEECGEVIQAATKCLRFGFDVDHGTGYGNNRHQLSKETGELLAVIEALPLDQFTSVTAQRGKIRRAETAKAIFGSSALHSTSAAGETTSSDGPEPASTIPAGACEPASAAIRHSGPSEAIPAVLAMRECPFCKSRCVTATVNAHGWKVVECDDCGASGPCIDLDGDQYIERWNARAAIDNPSPEAKAFIEQQAKALSEAEAERDRIARNRDMWRTQCERQADQITKLRGEVSALESEHANG